MFDFNYFDFFALFIFVFKLFLQMKLKAIFEVRKWKELEDRWVFIGNSSESKIILVEEDIMFVDFVEKIYFKIRASRDTFDV